MSVFVTSATGSTGRGVIDALSNSGHDIEIVAGVKDLQQVSTECRNQVKHQVMDIVSTDTSNNNKIDFQGSEMLFIIPPCSSITIFDHIQSLIIDREPCTRSTANRQLCKELWNQVYSTVKFDRT